MSRFPRADYRTLSPYSPDRRPAEIDLCDNTNLWGTPPGALNRIRQAPVEALTRYPSVYADGLREAISERFDLPVECVSTGCGSDDLLDSVFRASSTLGGSVSYMTPTFSMVGPFARMNGLTPHAVVWGQALSHPESLLSEDPAVVYLCSPNNPTGEELTHGWMVAFLALSGTDGPLVVVDEAYADFGTGSLLSMAPGHPRLLVLRTLSKAYGLAGLRVGFGVGAVETITEVEKSRGPYKVNRLAESAGVEAIEDSGGWVERVVTEVRENRARLDRNLKERGLQPLPSNANFILLPVTDRTAEETALALRDEGVAVRPFAALPEIGEAIRITIGPWAMMERFLAAFDTISS